jgi:hypothetical protein
MTKDGKWVKRRDKRRRPEPVQYAAWHHVGCQGQYHVADRGNRRIQVFDPI